MTLYDPSLVVRGVTQHTTPQNTDVIAAQAANPQSGMDINNPEPNADYTILTARIRELEKLCSKLCDELWMGDTPTWERREELNEELRKVEDEKWMLIGQARALMEVDS